MPLVCLMLDTACHTALRHQAAQAANGCHAHNTCRACVAAEVRRSLAVEMKQLRSDVGRQRFIDTLMCGARTHVVWPERRHRLPASVVESQNLVPSGSA